MKTQKTKGFYDRENDTVHIFIPPAPTESERGGITAKEKTTESLEVTIDSATGKAYVALDKTLSKTGEAADAAVVGEKLTSMGAAIENVKEDFANNKTFKLITSSDIVKQTKTYVTKDGELVEVPFVKSLGNFIVGNVEYSTDFSIIKLNLSAVRANRKEYDLLPFDNTRKTIDFGEIIPGFKPAKKIILTGVALNFSYISSAEGSSVPAFGGDVELCYNTEGHLVLQYFTWSKATEEKPYLNTSFNIWDTIYTNVI